MLALTCMWSPSFLFIKLATYDLPPMTIVSLRVSIAAAILCAMLIWKRQGLPMTWAFWLRSSGMALFSSIIPFSLFCYAEQSIDSAMAAIINGTAPMFTAVLAQLFVASDRLNMQKGLGIILSSCGLVWLFAPQLQAGVDATTMGMSAALLASVSYAASHVYGKLYTTGQKPYVAPTAQMLASSVILWPFAMWHDEVWRLPWPSTPAIMGVCGLALLGTVCAFIIYYKLLDHCGPTAISMVSCFFPVGGMLLGFLFLGESFTTAGMLAAGLILLGLLTVNNIIPMGFLSKPKDVSPANESITETIEIK